MTNSMTTRGHGSRGVFGVWAALLTLCACLFSLPASAVPIQVGTDYRARTYESSAPAIAFDAVATFDGVAESFSISTGGTATINESQTALGGGLFRIDIVVTADADLFAAANVGNASFNIGGGNPFDLTGAFFTVANILTFTDADGNSSSASVPRFVGQLWDGTWLTNRSFGGLVGAAARDIRRIDLSITVRAVPEPPTLAVLGLGLIGLGVMRRRSIG